MARFDRLEFDTSDEEPTREGVTPQIDRDEKYWMRLADDNRRSGLYENSLRFYSRALERDKSLLAGWLGQVQMLIALEEYPEAELWSRKALELFRNNGDLMAGRAQALGRRGDRKNALELCDGSLRVEGLSSYRWMVRGELMLLTSESIDRHCFDKAVQLDSDWLVSLEIALIYLHYRKPSNAQARARQAVEKSPQSAYAWYVQGVCEAELNLIRPAKRSFERCLELSPRHLEAERRLEALARQGWSLGKSLRRFFGLS